MATVPVEYNYFSGEYKQVDYRYDGPEHGNTEAIVRCAHTDVCGRSFNNTLGTFAPKMFPSIQCFLNLPYRKAMIYFCQKGEKNRGSPTKFWGEVMPGRTP